MTAHLIDRCGVCASTQLEPVLSLGASPPTCVMAPVGQRPATEELHPLELVRCMECTLVQLSVVVDPEVVFPADYPYSSGNSRQLHDNFRDLADQAVELADLKAGDLVVDIGANDGTLLRKFPAHVKTVGVEPTAQADKITGHSCRAFFGEKIAKSLKALHGPAKVVCATNVLAHVKDVHDAMRGIRLLLADDGILIAENHNLGSLIAGCQWDFVYHEHLRYFDPGSFATLLRWHGLAVSEFRHTETHGGSFRTVAQAGESEPPRHRPDYDFAGLAEIVRSTRRAIRDVTGPGTWGLGATARATTLTNVCGLDIHDVQCVVEVPESDKVGRLIPGTNIPVVSEELLFSEQPDRLLLFSWHLAGYIVPKLRDRGYQGEILVPLPELHAATPATPIKETVR